MNRFYYGIFSNVTGYTKNMFRCETALVLVEVSSLYYRRQLVWLFYMRQATTRNVYCVTITEHEILLLFLPFLPVIHFSSYPSSILEELLIENTKQKTSSKQILKLGSQHQRLYLQKAMIATIKLELHHCKRCNFATNSFSIIAGTPGCRTMFLLVETLLCGMCTNRVYIAAYFVYTNVSSNVSIRRNIAVQYVQKPCLHR